jgi:hypothetical protein
MRDGFLCLVAPALCGMVFYCLLFFIVCRFLFIVCACLLADMVMFLLPCAGLFPVFITHPSRIHLICNPFGNRFFA